MSAIGTDESAPDEPVDAEDPQITRPAEAVRIDVQVVQVAAGRAMSSAVDADGGL